VSTTAGSAGHPQTAAALAARRTDAQAALQRVHDAPARLKREQAPVTIAAVARRAGVSRTLDERLKAARSNMRFQDRRLADLEAQLAVPPARA
jgi:hypothetical protein